MSDKIQYKENAILFMQITAPKYGEPLGNDVKAATGILGGSAMISPSKTGSMLSLIGAGGWYSVAVGAVLGVYQTGSVAWNRAITTSYCRDSTMTTDFLGGSGGCTVVRVTDYDMSSLRQYCNVIESIP
jgi:hypothetical protein